MKYKFQWDANIGPELTFYINSKELTFCLCHKNIDRSIKCIGIEQYLCARCLGIIIGIILGTVLSIFVKNIAYYIVFLMVIPLIIDGVTQSFGIRESNNKLRLVTGILFGIGCSLLIFR